ncbi:MAG: polyprenol monophosphomannose synthase [Candidatus Bruticola sp.]
MIQLSLIVPTYNEKETLPVLAERVFNVLDKSQIDGELIVVDDNSPDGTADLAASLNKKYQNRIKVIKRSGKLGLSSAVITGWQAGSGQILGVIDSDLSHDPNILPHMVYSITNGGADIALGSRYIKGGGVRNWPWYRVITSLTAAALGRIICPANDVTSGYMLMKRQVIEGVELNPIGFKINLEVMVKGNYRTIAEVPFIFEDRLAGKSKFNGSEIINYLKHLASLFGYWLKNRPQHKRIPYTPFPQP